MMTTCIRVSLAGLRSPAYDRRGGRDGRQYVVITATGGGFLGSPLTDDRVTAFAVPR